MTKLLLIRHGESIANRDRKFVGHINADLSDKGLMQAEKTAVFVAENYNAEKVYASDLQRAFKTGKAVSDLLGIKIIPDENMREIYAGEWEGNKFDDLAIKFQEEYKVWLTDIGNAHPNGGESVKELASRIMNELTKIAEENDGKTIVVATHATPIRVMQSLVQTGGLDEMKNISWVSNASVTELIYDNGYWYFGNVSLDEHLADLKTVFGKNV